MRLLVRWSVSTEGVFGGRLSTEQAVWLSGLTGGLGGGLGGEEKGDGARVYSTRYSSEGEERVDAGLHSRLHYTTNSLMQVADLMSMFRVRAGRGKFSSGRGHAPIAEPGPFSAC